MKVSEIRNTDILLSARGKKKPVNSIFYRETDFRKVYKTLQEGNLIYFTIDEQDYLTALVATTPNNELIRFENIVGKPGLVTTIILSILEKERQLKIKPSEELTPDGLQWLLKSVRLNKYFTVTDYYDNPIDPIALEADWNNNGGEIGLSLAANDNLTEAINRNQVEYRKLVKDEKNTLIMPMLKWLGDKDSL